MDKKEIISNMSSEEEINKIIQKDNEDIQKKEEKQNRIRKICKNIMIIVFIILIIWFAFAMYEMYRVKTDRDTLVCINSKKDIEDDDEYSVMCYGIFYKYKKYYYKTSNKLSAREFTLFFTDFKRGE